MISSRRTLLVATFGGTLALAGCRSPSPTEIVRDKVKNAVEKNKDALADFGTIVTKNSKLTGNDAQGRPLWSLQFKLGKVRNGDDAKILRRGDLENANAILFRDGRPETSFKADQINFSDGEGGLTMTLSGNVRAHRVLDEAQKSLLPQSPLQLKTQKLDINVSTKQLRADAPITMARGKTIVVAQKMTADTSLAVARATNGVVATSPQGRVTSKNAVWSWAKNCAQMSGDVTISRDATKLVGENLDADINVSRGILSGKNGVTAISPQGQAKAQRVLYNWNDGRISALGDVTMQKDGATLRAAQIDADDKLNRASANGEVILTRGDAVVTAAQLSAFDRMTRVVANGGVTLKRPNETLSARNAIIWLNEKRATASGDVRLTRADGTLTANRADYNANSAYIAVNGDVTIRRAGAIFKAERAEYWANSGRAVGSGDVSLTRDDVTVNAQRVEAANVADKSRTQIVASGNVRAQSSGGVVRGDRVTWTNRGAIATGDVSLQKSGNTLSGARLQTDAQFGRAVLSGGVSGNLANGATFSGSSMTWNRVLDGRVLPQNGQVIARGGVVLRRAGVVLRAPNLSASGDGRSVLLSGGVVADGKDGAQVRAQTARYDATKGNIVAQGNVWYRDASGNRLYGTNLAARLANNTLQNATLDNVKGRGSSQIFSGKTLFGN